MGTLARPDTDSTGLDTAADALVELLSALARRQHQHRSHTVARLTTVIDGRLLPDDLQHMALYYRAKAHRDLGDSPASRAGMQAVADGRGRLAPAARRGLAHLARMAGDFPTALATAHTLGGEGRHHRVEGDIWWPHGDMDRAAAAYAAARDEAEHHGVTGERGNSQAHRAFALAFTDPAVADDELALAEQLLAGVDLRATTLITHIAALARDAGRTHADIDDRAHVLRAEIRTAGVTYTELALDLALAFHHAVRDDQDQVAMTIARLRESTRGGDFAYYSDIAAFMAGMAPAHPSGTRWVDSEPATRQRWRALVTARAATTCAPRLTHGCRTGRSSRWCHRCSGGSPRGSRVGVHNARKAEQQAHIQAQTELAQAQLQLRLEHLNQRREPRAQAYTAVLSLATEILQLLERALGCQEMNDEAGFHALAQEVEEKLKDFQPSTPGSA